MNKNLKIALIIIVILVGLYYFISPYQNCMRSYKSPSNSNVNESWHKPENKSELHTFAIRSCENLGW